MTKCLQFWTHSPQTLETGSSQFHCNVSTKNERSYKKSWIFIKINRKNPSVYVPTEPGSAVVIATRYGLEGPRIEFRWGEIFRTYPDRLRGPPSLLYNGYRVFPGGKGCRGVMLNTHPSSAELKKELSYTSTHPMSPPGPVTGFPLPLPICTYCRSNYSPTTWCSICL
jgi:hypothetical protein